VSAPFLQRVVTRAGRKVVKAVDGVTFSIERGTTFSIVGESGCGKSTITRLVAGLERPTAGAVSFHKAGGRPIQLQMVFQDPIGSLNPRWRIGRSIAEPMESSMTRAQRRERVGDLLKTVGLAAVDGAKYPHEFSGGQRQRISIARALAADAELLLLDEPTSALDVSVQAQVLNLLKDLQERLGLTYLFISHNLSVVRFLTDRIGVMYLGRLVEEGASEAVFESPQHPYTQLLARGANVIEIVTGGQSKTQRLDAVMGKITAQYVHIVGGIPGIDAFLDELTAFPYGSNDDQVDALTQYLQWLSISEPAGVPDPVFRKISPRPNRIDRYRPKT
jgi:peptide/nickel transport system ATP-binding protein